MKKKKGFLDGYATYDTSGGYGSASEWQSAFSERMSHKQAETVIREQEQTPHQLLGVAQAATKSEIRKAYLLLIKEWHPDRNAHRLTEAVAMSQKIIAAYTLLSK